jgi:hypothetical protein
MGKPIAITPIAQVTPHNRAYRISVSLWSKTTGGGN